jgi:hypothetical protein
MATLVRSLPTRPRDSTFSAPAPPLSPAALDGGRPLSGASSAEDVPDVASLPPPKPHPPR